jgi:N6-L-threonylcarbamoyladenine synthase
MLQEAGCFALVLEKIPANLAKQVSQTLNIPTIGVNHLHAHIGAHYLNEQPPQFPFLCLLVSGGHTQIVQCNSASDLKIIGETIDDAAGEAFDKIAKIIGLPYPGGPLMDKLAQEGNPLAFEFAKPSVPDLNYSFSGLKTSVLYFLQKQAPDFIENNKADLCASVQYTIVTILLKKLKKAMQETGIKEICIAGGVSANSGLRKGIQELGEKMKANVYLPQFQYCTDNAAMIAIAAHYKYLEGAFDSLDVTASARSNW